MPDYAIRVELRGNPSADEYQTLHSLMGRKGFAQTIAGVDRSGSRRLFSLPHAVYYGSSPSDCAAVRDSVLSAVKAQVQSEVIVFAVHAETWSIGA